MDNNQKISALINLLDDPDERIYDQISRELQGLGLTVVPHLEDAWGSSYNSLFQGRVEQIIHQIQFRKVKDELGYWSTVPGASLLEAALIVAQYQYVDIDIEGIRDFVDRLTRDVWLELNDTYTAIEKVQTMNKVFFEIYGFSGNRRNFHSPRNLYINNVVEARKGSPVSLSVLYLEVARRLKLPIYGVNLAEHFILAYVELPIEYIDAVQKENILFYINPFNKGVLFQYKDIEEFVLQLKLNMQEKFYLPCSKQTVIDRLLNNLIFAYEKTGYREKVEELTLLKSCLSNS
jgi:regulator of sirC expression with transglutaminase-like and TPR domain